MRKLHWIQMQMFAEEKQVVNLPGIWWLNLKNIFITHIVLCTSGRFKSQYYCPWRASLFFHKCFQSTAAVPHWASLWNCSITLLSEPFSEYTCCNSCYMRFFFMCSSFLECSALQCLGGAGLAVGCSLWTSLGTSALAASLPWPSQPCTGAFPPTSQRPFRGLTASYLGHSIDSLHGNAVHQSS